jgi:hypothetical protein
VLGELSDLPLKNLHIVPFNIDHALKAGEFAKILFEERGILKENLKPRAIIPNDSKLFAQADLDKTISYFITSDSRSGNTIGVLKNKATIRFNFLDISIPYNHAFGILDLK